MVTSIIRYFCKIQYLYCSFFFFYIEEDAPRIVEDEKEVRKRRLEEKKRLKANFDQNYDEGGKTHYDDLKREVEQQTMVSRHS